MLKDDKTDQSIGKEIKLSATKKREEKKAAFFFFLHGSRRAYFFSGFLFPQNYEFLFMLTDISN